MRLQKTFRSFLAIFCFAFASVANAALVDFTSRVWGEAINDGDGTTATVGNVTLTASNGILTFNSSNSETSGCMAGVENHGLACSGDGIGINNDEITESGDVFTSIDQTITISFAAPVDVTNVFLLDLFANETSSHNDIHSSDSSDDSSDHDDSSSSHSSDSGDSSSDHDDSSSSHSSDSSDSSSDHDDSSSSHSSDSSDSSSDHDDSSSSHSSDSSHSSGDHDDSNNSASVGEIAVIDGLLFGPPADSLDNLGGYYETGFNKWGALTVVLSGNTDDYSDYSLAAIEIGMSPVPVPGAFILFGTVLLGMFGIKRFK